MKYWWHNNSYHGKWNWKTEFKFKSSFLHLFSTNAFRKGITLFLLTIDKIVWQPRFLSLGRVPSLAEGSIKNISLLFQGIIMEKISKEPWLFESWRDLAFDKIFSKGLDHWNYECQNQAVCFLWENIGSDTNNWLIFFLI